MKKVPPSDWEKEYEVKKQGVLEQMEALKSEPKLDEDGYPTIATLTLIEIWWWEDSAGWFKFIKSIWHQAWWGWGEEVVDHEYRKNRKVLRYRISTAGWSGNESIISAMEKNKWMWHTHWVQSRRGGHYIFEVEALTE